MAENITSAKATGWSVFPLARFVCSDTIRNKSVAEAFAILKFTPNGLRRRKSIKICSC